MNNTNQTLSENAIFSLFSGDDPEIVAHPFALLAQMRSAQSPPVSRTSREVPIFGRNLPPSGPSSGSDGEQVRQVLRVCMGRSHKGRPW